MYPDCVLVSSVQGCFLRLPVLSRSLSTRFGGSARALRGPRSVVLDVPYIQQKDINGCGAAALLMVYQYYGKKIFSEANILNDLKRPAPHNPDEFFIPSASLSEHASYRKFKAEMRQLKHATEQQVAEELDHYVTKAAIPLIACQKYTDALPQVGHFRIVLGIENGNVIFHDPSREFGGAALSWPLARFTEYWQATGEAVQGGYAVLVSTLALPPPLPVFRSS